VRTWLIPHAPRFYWLIILAFAASTITSDLPGFGEGHWSTSTAFRACIIATALGLAALSEIWDIAPAVIVNAEARYQNRQAREVYTIPVVFDAAPTVVAGMSRLRAPRKGRRANGRTASPVAPNGHREHDESALA
jgi:hypothetical protein